MSTITQECQVCQEAVSKYKCPRCRLKYCSVGCYKVHQSQDCQAKDAEPSVVLEVDTEGHISYQQVLFPTDDTVLPHTLEKLRSCSDLKQLLNNPHLREMLREVDGAAKAEVVVQRAMMEPIFTEFADIVLSVVEPDQEGTSRESEVE